MCSRSTHLRLHVMLLDVLRSTNYFTGISFLLEVLLHRQGSCLFLIFFVFLPLALVCGQSCGGAKVLTVCPFKPSTAFSADISLPRLSREEHIIEPGLVQLNVNEKVKAWGASGAVAESWALWCQRKQSSKDNYRNWADQKHE